MSIQRAQSRGNARGFQCDGDNATHDGAAMKIDGDTLPPMKFGTRQRIVRLHEAWGIKPPVGDSPFALEFELLGRPLFSSSSTIFGIP